MVKFVVNEGFEHCYSPVTWDDVGWWDLNLLTTGKEVPQRGHHSLGPAQLASAGTAPEAPVDLPEVEVSDRRLELGVVQHLLDDGLVGLHPSHDGAEEAAIEDEAEVLRGSADR